MDSPRPPGPPTKRWELHALVGLLLLALGMTFRRSFDPEPFVLSALAGLTFGIIGLFRRNLWAWWGMLFAFVILAFGSVDASIELVGRYGFRLHRQLLAPHAVSLSFVAGVGLLLSVRIRGAYFGPVAPFWEELPALQHVLAVAAPTLFVLAAVFSIGIVGVFHVSRNSNDRVLSGSLKTIMTAEADFRANDRNGNVIQEFWTADVQGLYAVTATGSQGPIRLIELSVALADSNPLTGAYPALPMPPTSKAGGWFSALREDRSENPPLRYRDAEVSRSRFGFLAFPADYVAGSPLAFIVNEQNTIYRRWLKLDVCPSGKTPPGPVTAPGFADWPSEAELKADWATQD